MARKPHQVESTGTARALYMALELGSTRWVVAFRLAEGEAERRHVISAGDRAALERAIGEVREQWGLPETAPVRSCYEAGRDGFWVHRFLTAVGVENRVVDSASIEVNRRARRLKTDRLDATKLATMLVRYWRGEPRVWQVVRVPSMAEEDARHAHRTIAMLVTERTRLRNQLHGLLALHGVRQRLDARFLERLPQVRTWAGEALPPGLVARLTVSARLLAQVTAELVAARRAQRAEVRAAATPAAAMAARLAQLRGVGAGSAVMLAQEVFVRELRNRREVGALSGFVPVRRQSGAFSRDVGISRAGLPAVRRVLVELAWSWIRWQPTSDLTQWYVRRFGSGGPRMRRIGTVALGRKLLIALWRYAKEGIVPAGAELRPV